MVNIESALSFFELAYPAGAKERLLVDALSVVYGARDVFSEWCQNEDVDSLANDMFSGHSNLRCCVLWLIKNAGLDYSLCRRRCGRGRGCMQVHGRSRRMVSLGLRTNACRPGCDSLAWAVNVGDSSLLSEAFGPMAV